MLVNLLINACTEKKTEGVKDCAETFVRQSCSICVFALYARETVIFLYGLYLFYFVGTMAKEFIYPYAYIFILYKYDIILFLSLSPASRVQFTIKLEFVIELKGFVCIICVYVGVVLWPASLPVIT